MDDDGTAEQPGHLQYISMEFKSSIDGLPTFVPLIIDSRSLYAESHKVPKCQVSRPGLPVTWQTYVI